MRPAAVHRGSRRPGSIAAAVIIGILTVAVGLNPTEERISLDN